MHRGHKISFFPGSTGVTDSGNHLKNNVDIDVLKREYKICLSRMGGITLLWRPFRADFICKHVEKYWMRTRIGNIRDVQLKPLFLAGIQCGLRYDEFSKLRLSHVSIIALPELLSIDIPIKVQCVSEMTLLKSG